MPKYDRSVFESIKSRIQISRLVSRYMPVSDKNGRKWVVCPFHSDKNPSMILNDETGMFHCFGCGISGTVFDFLMQYRHISFPQAVEELAGECGIELEPETQESRNRRNEKEELYSIYESLAGEFSRMLMSDEGGRAARYLDGRNISKSAREEFMLGYAPDDRDFMLDFLRKKKFSDELIYKAGLFSREGRYPYFVDRITFPIKNEHGNVVAFSARALKSGDKIPKYINSSETSIFHKGENFYAFYQSLPQLRKSVPPVICEGNFDAMAMHLSGIGTALATCGTALTDSHVSILRRFSSKAFLFFDNDDAGAKATKAAALKLINSGMHVNVLVLDKYKDACEAYQSEGPGFLKELLSNSVTYENYLYMNGMKKADVSSLSYKDEIVREFVPYYNAIQSDIEKIELVRFVSSHLDLPEKVVADCLDTGESQIRGNNGVPVRPVAAGNANFPLYEMDLMRMLTVRRDFFFSDMIADIKYQDLRNSNARILYKNIADCSRDAVLSDEIFIREIKDSSEQDYVKEVLFRYKSVYYKYSREMAAELAGQAYNRIKRASSLREREMLKSYTFCDDSDEMRENRMESAKKFCEFDSKVRR